MKFQSIIAVILLFTFSSCDNDENICNNTTINVSQLETKNGCTNVSIDLTETYMIIKNQLDFSEFVNATCQSEIDFSTYDLVIGRKGLTNGLSSIEYKLTEFCETGDQTLDIIINLNETTESPNITYNALIPKLRENQELTVDITTN